MRERLNTIGTVVFGCALALPFVGVAAFLLGAGWLTVVGAAAVMTACGVTVFFDDGLTWLAVPGGLLVGGVGALLAWVFHWNILHCAAFAVCLGFVLLLSLLFLLVARLSA